MAADRPDIQLSVKKVCRDMATPSTGSWRKLERTSRHLVSCPRLVWRFDLQHELDNVDALPDANWAACRISRKSTSGGRIMFRTHLIKSRSKTQAMVAKSSAESELYGIVSITCESLGFVALLEDVGTHGGARLHIRATPA